MYIGKVNINSEILTKAGRLTKEEWKEMKQHPGMGKNIILKHLSKNFFKFSLFIFKNRRSSNI